MHTVYKITNLVNGKIYIGVHAVIDVNNDDGYMGSGLRIKRAIKKYGREAFKKEILVSFEDGEAAYLAESMVVDEAFIARDDTYNMRCGGRGGSLGIGEKNPQYGMRGEKCPNYGKKASEETRKKLSDATSGEKNPMYGKTGTNSPNYGKPRSEETKKKISASNIGKTFTEETRQKMSDSKNGKKNPMYGRKLSETHKQKLLDSNIGKIRSKETRQKISCAKKESYHIKKETQLTLTGE